MTRETIYRWLVRLYPARFRRQYETEMLDAFRAFSRDNPHAPARFWTIILRDVVRSAAREHVDAWTSGMRQFAAYWVCACVFGTAMSGLAIWTLLGVLNAMFPPHLGSDGAVRLVTRDLPGALWGAVIGLAIGGAQAWALRSHLRRPFVWTAATSLAVGIGIPLGLATANGVGGLVGFSGYYTGVALLGALVGAVQSVLLTQRTVSSLKWIGASVFAVAAGVLAGVTCQAVVRANPRSWLGLALAFVVYPAVIGLVMGLVTVQPLAAAFSRDRKVAG